MGYKGVSKKILQSKNLRIDTWNFAVQNAEFKIS